MESGSGTTRIAFPSNYVKMALWSSMGEPPGYVSSPFLASVNALSLPATMIYPVYFLIFFLPCVAISPQKSPNGSARA